MHLRFHDTTHRVCSVAAVWLSTLIGANVVSGQDLPRRVPKVHKHGPSLKFDFPEMLVGVAEYEEGPTGTTVFYFPDGVKAAVDVRGGAPGTVNATSLMNSYDRKMMEAVVFSGGSWYGLSAATGVANGIKELEHGKGKVDFIAGVVAAIIYDVGARRFSRVTPDDRLGKAALQAAEPGWFPLGARGAGRFAMQGAYFVHPWNAEGSASWPHSGQGGAFRTIGPTKIGVFCVVNSMGAIVDRDGRVVRCGRNNSDGECPLITDQLEWAGKIIEAESGTDADPTNNTTLTLVVTNQKMPFAALRRLAVQVHGSMSRAIQPFATRSDGDVLYAVTTDAVENPGLSPLDISVIASELAWDAVLSSVPDLPPAAALLETSPNAVQLTKYSGTYQFYGGGELTVGIEEGSLTATFQGNGRMYFDNGRKYSLAAAEDGVFIVESPARDVVLFDDSGGRITGLTINPGPWPVKANRRD